MIEIYKDVIANKLDELSDVGILWKKYREGGEKPTIIRKAMIDGAREITMLETSEKKEWLDELKRTKDNS